MENKKLPSSYQEVKQLMLSMEYKWFDGIMDPNLVFFRMSEIYTNEFSDYFCICLKDQNGSEYFRLWSCSTKPALYGKGAVMEPNTIHGIKGVGVLAHGQHLGAWKMTNFDQLKYGDPFKGNPHLVPSMHQVGKFKCYRDGNLDTKINKEILMDSFPEDGFNFHYATGKYLSFKNSGYLPWSTGCPTSTPDVLIVAFDVLEKTIAFSGDIISPTIIEMYG